MSLYHEYFDETAASLDPLFNLPQHHQQQATAVADPFLEEFAEDWMEMDLMDADEDIRDDPNQSCIPTAPAAPIQTSVVVDLTDTATTNTTSDTTSSSYDNNNMDDAVSVVSVGSLEEFKIAPPPPLPPQVMLQRAARSMTTRRASFMNTCHELDSFMASAFEMGDEEE